MAKKNFTSTTLPADLVERCLKINEKKKLGYTGLADILKSLMRDFLKKHDGGEK